ncbi:uncharacterized protein LOC120067463 [Benincasa hispida]|uniref:uncharacterized protein LOC120067463 n=1 Tax=Benincasa hispida TaxID=102211 RepID=UPI0018FFA46B|nr:uncharacterized protein LOC120067463 [Benincasa hispida]
MRLGGEHLKRNVTPLLRFGGQTVYLEGGIELSVTFGGGIAYMTAMVEFLVVDDISIYNVILGRTSLHQVKVVPFTYHQLLKFLALGGVGIMRGEQLKSRKCYKIAMRNPQGKVEVVHVISNLARKENEKVCHAIEESDVKAQISIPLWYRPRGVRVHAVGRAAVVDTTLDVVFVWKANGKWRICIDFTDLNKACLKDSFPLPRIDKLVKATVDHELLSFMDDYSSDAVWAQESMSHIPTE